MIRAALSSPTFRMRATRSGFAATACSDTAQVGGAPGQAARLQGRAFAFRRRGGPATIPGCTGIRCSTSRRPRSFPAPATRATGCRTTMKSQAHGSIPSRTCASRAMRSARAASATISEAVHGRSRIRIRPGRSAPRRGRPMAIHGDRAWQHRARQGLSNCSPNGPTGSRPANCRSTSRSGRRASSATSCTRCGIGQPTALPARRDLDRQAQSDGQRQRPDLRLAGRKHRSRADARSGQERSPRPSSIPICDPETPSRKTHRAGRRPIGATSRSGTATPASTTR